MAKEKATLEILQKKLVKVCNKKSLINNEYENVVEEIKREEAFLAKTSEELLVVPGKLYVEKSFDVDDDSEALFLLVTNLNPTTTWGGRKYTEVKFTLINCPLDPDDANDLDYAIEVGRTKELEEFVDDYVEYKEDDVEEIKTVIHNFLNLRHVLAKRFGVETKDV